jgi:hypothetical protein
MSRNDIFFPPFSQRDLSCPTVKEEIRPYSSHYGDRLRTHPNHLAVNLLRLPDNTRLRRGPFTNPEEGNVCRWKPVPEDW